MDKVRGLRRRNKGYHCRQGGGSSLRYKGQKQLEKINDFLEDLYDEGAAEEDFLTVVSDLTSDDGLTDCETSEDKVALITCDDYRKYRSLISIIKDYWWTITPWSCNSAFSYYVRHVNTFGALYYDSAYGSFGVRPLCNLKSDTLVSFEETGEEEKEGTEDAKEKVLRLLSEAIEIMKTL